MLVFFNLLNLLLFFSTFIPLFAFPTVLFPFQLIFYINLHLPLFNFAYLFFLFFFPLASTYLLVLFSLLYTPIHTLL